MKFLLIAPYKGLAEAAFITIKDYPDVQIDICQGNYVTGPLVIKERNADAHYDAVITRGGTVLTCRQVTELPVIEIRATAFDVFRIIKQASHYKGRKAFYAFANLAQPFRQFCGLLGVEIDTFEYEAHADAERELERLREKGYDLVIGDTLVYRKAQSMGMDSMLLTSGLESIRDAIEEALRLCDYARQKKMNTEKPGQLEKSSLPSVMTVFPKTLQKEMVDFAKTPLPTMIVGAPGMCKSDIGILCAAYNKKGKLKRISCADVISLEELSENTIYFFEHINELSLELQKQLVPIIRHAVENPKIKIFSSIDKYPAVCVKERTLLPALRNLLGEVEFRILPLSSYAEEIGNMVSLYLAKQDAQNGNYIGAVDAAGVKLLKEYPWPGNLRQFMRVMNRLTVAAGLYITERAVKKVLAEEAENNRIQSVALDLSGTLSDIEKRVLYQVMLEEGHNQSRVEKRLQISHSTLWRKLKQYDLI